MALGAHLSGMNNENSLTTGFKINCWESFFINTLQKQNLLTEELKVNDPNPLFELAQDVKVHKVHN